jgi:heme oxygenase
VSLRQQLKHATASDHERLETRLALTSAAVSLHDYVLYLECTYGYYAAVEPILSRSEHLTGLGINTASFAKLDALASDLAFFGRSPPAAPAAIAYVPGHAAIPELLGCSYVLEGAALGGVVLYRHFQNRFGVTREKGASFFYGDGRQTASRWAAFVEALDRTGLTSAEEGACVSAARATFRCMDAWFAEKGWG